MGISIDRCIMLNVVCVAVESFAESLFWHLGITSPQYLHIIEMYEDMKEEVSVSLSQV